MKNGLTKEQAALYDRQIRLWGVTSQEHISNATVTLVGTGGCAQEIAKNLLLKGIKKLVVVDGAVISARASTSCSAGRGLFESLEELQSLNPMVTIEQRESLFNQDDSFNCTDSDVIVIVNFVADMEKSTQSNQLYNTEQLKIIWIWTVDSDGLCGCWLINCLAPAHTFIDNQERSHTLPFPPLAPFFTKHRHNVNKPTRRGQPFFHHPSLVMLESSLITSTPNTSGNVKAIVSSVDSLDPCLQSIVGGLVVQEAIKVVTKRDMPIHCAFWIASDLDNFTVSL